MTVPDKNTTAGKPGEPPEHYRTPSGMQPFDVIDGYGFGFYDGNALRYLLRAQKKGMLLNDLKKARHYIQEEEERLRSGMGLERMALFTPAEVEHVVAEFGLPGNIASAVRSLLASRLYSGDHAVHLKAARKAIEAEILESGETVEN